MTPHIPPAARACVRCRTVAQLDRAGYCAMCSEIDATGKVSGATLAQMAREAIGRRILRGKGRIVSHDQIP